MFDNNYSYNPETNETQTSGYPSGDNGNQGGQPPKKNNGFKKTVKAIAFIVCMAAVSVGSIAGYRYIDENGIPFISTSERNDMEEARKLPKDDASEASETKENTGSSDNGIKTELLTESSLVNIQQKTEPMTTQAIYRKVLPSVVGVTSVFQYEQPSYDFWGFGSDSTTKEVSGTGTGIVMSADGYILTNAHVISSDDYGVSNKITVRMSDETEYDAVIVGYDRQTDLAVLKADAEGLTAAEFGSSENLKVGDPALAIGNPLGFDLFGTLTAGYISGLDREVSVNDTTMKLIQTDAAINSGNSGGPLINEYGQVIGINSMKLSSSYSSSSATIEGLGFAIPIDDAKKIIDDLTAYGYVTGRPQLGITYRDLSQQGTGSSGVMVVGVNKNGPADKAGIKAGDIIVGVDGELVSNADDLKKFIKECGAGDELKLTIVRNRNYYDVNVTLEDLKPDSLT